MSDTDEAIRCLEKLDRLVAGDPSATPPTDEEVAAFDRAWADKKRRDYVVLKVTQIK